MIPFIVVTSCVAYLFFATIVARGLYEWRPSPACRRSRIDAPLGSGHAFSCIGDCMMISVLGGMFFPIALFVFLSLKIGSKFAPMFQTTEMKRALRKAEIERLEREAHTTTTWGSS